MNRVYRAGANRRKSTAARLWLLAWCCALVVGLFPAAPVAAQRGSAEWSDPAWNAGESARGNAAWSEPARPEPMWNVPAWDEPTAPVSANAVSGSSGGTHVVQAGETLVSIARHYGLTVPQLVRVNSLGQPPSITPGQTLTLPGGASSAGSSGNQTEWSNWETPTRGNSEWGSPAQENSAWERPTWDAPSVGSRQTSAYGGGAPPAPSNVGKTILISTAQQYLWAYENGQLVLQTPVTTGRPGADTPKGTYPILAKYSPYRFISPFPVGHEFYYDPVDSNYSLRITWEGHHIHDAPWRTDFGPGTNLPHNNSRGQWATGSIGCVNVPTSAMARLYQWADEGILVTVE